MLDGRAASLEEQIHLPLESPREMNIDWMASLARLNAVSQIQTSLASLDTPALTKTLVVKSLAAYVRSLVSGGSPFDRYYYGGDETAISEEAKEGLLLFERKGRCAGCHLITGYAAPLTDDAFHSVGVGFENGAYKDPGRFAVTNDTEDLGVFKTPTLRNVAERRYFMHDGSMKSLKEVLAYYNRGGNSGAPNLDGRVHPLMLSEAEEASIIAFLQTLSAPVVSYSPKP